MLKIIYVIRNDMRAIASLPFRYFFTEIFKSLTISNVWRVIHKPENPITREQSASFSGADAGVIESIITPFDISNIPQSNAVIISFLNGENTNKSSQITEKKTI